MRRISPAAAKLQLSDVVPLNNSYAEETLAFLAGSGHACLPSLPFAGSDSESPAEFYQQCLGDDGSRPTRSQQSGQGRQKMHEDHQKVTHGPRSYRFRLGLQVYEMRAIYREL